MAALQSLNPATGEVVGSVEVATRDGVAQAFDAARRAQAEWASRSLKQRARLVERFGALLLRDRLAVAETVTREEGKPLVEALATEVMVAGDQAAWLLREGLEWLEGSAFRPRNILLRNRRSRLVHHPLGVVGIIAPWNYPFSIPATQVLPALLAGNGVVLKPSSETPLTGERLVELLHDAGAPEDLVQAVHGPGRTVGEAVVENADGVVFTGSVESGQAVGQQAVRRFTPCVLELGGKDPALVLPDADLAKAARGIAWAAYSNAGQSCASVERVLVHEAVADRLQAELVRQAESLRVGNGLDTVDMGPLVNAGAAKRVQGVVEEAVKEGATVAAGGRAPAGLGPAFFAPTVLTQVQPGMRAMTDETFGPVLPLLEVHDEESMVEIANGTPYGLTASVWTRNRRTGQRLARRLRAGTVTVNDHLSSYAATESPWGGPGASGLGHTHGVWGLQAVTRLQHISAQGAHAAPWWFPYDQDARKLMEEGPVFLYGRPIQGLGAVAPLLRRLRRR